MSRSRCRTLRVRFDSPDETARCPGVCRQGCRYRCRSSACRVPSPVVGLPSARPNTVDVPECRHCSRGYPPDRCPKGCRALVVALRPGLPQDRARRERRCRPWASLCTKHGASQPFDWCRTGPYHHRLPASHHHLTTSRPVVCGRLPYLRPRPAGALPGAGAVHARAGGFGPGPSGRVRAANRKVATAAAAETYRNPLCHCSSRP